jgi:hypothetical protein
VKSWTARRSSVRGWLVTISVRAMGVIVLEQDGGTLENAMRLQVTVRLSLVCRREELARTAWSLSSWE